MKKTSKIAVLSPAQLTSTLAKVDQAIGHAPKPSRALVVRVLSEQGLCSPKSSGAEMTLVKAALAAGVPLPASLSALLNVQQMVGAALTAGRPAPAVTPAEKAETTLLCLKSASVLQFMNGQLSKGTFMDGSSMDGGKLGESDLRASCNLIEFSVSLM